MNTFRIALANWSGRLVGTFAVLAPMASGAVSPDGSMVVSGSAVYAIDGRIVGSVGINTWGDSLSISTDDQTICDATNPAGAGPTVLRRLGAGQSPQTLRTLTAGWQVIACGPAGGDVVVGRFDPSRSGPVGFAEVAGYSLQNGTRRFDFAYPPAKVSSLAVSLDGTLLAEGGWPDGARIRRLPGGEQLATVAAPGADVWLFSGDGTRIAIRPNGDSTRVVAWQSGAVLYESSTPVEPVARPGRPELLLVVPMEISGVVSPSQPPPPFVQLLLLVADGPLRQTWP